MNQPFITRIEQGCGSKTNKTHCKFFSCIRDLSPSSARQWAWRIIIIILYLHYEFSMVCNFLPGSWCHACMATTILQCQQHLFFFRLRNYHPPSFGIKIKIAGFLWSPPQGNQNYLLNAADTPASQPWGLDWISISDCNLALAYLPDI